MYEYISGITIICIIIILIRLFYVSVSTKPIPTAAISSAPSYSLLSVTDTGSIENLDPTSVLAPIGTIIMWTRTDEIPDGWVECDGNNGTPDLRGFILAGKTDSGQFSTLNDTIGNDTTSLEANHMLQHSHGISKFHRTLVDRQPHPRRGENARVDNFPVLGWGASSDFSSGSYYGTNVLKFDTSGGDHCFVDRHGQHVTRDYHVRVPSTTNNTGNSAPFSVVQPVYRLTYIMKIAQPITIATTPADTEEPVGV